MFGHSKNFSFVLKFMSQNKPLHIPFHFPGNPIVLNFELHDTWFTLILLELPVIPKYVISVEVFRLSECERWSGSPFKKNSIKFPSTILSSNRSYAVARTLLGIQSNANGKLLLFECFLCQWDLLWNLIGNFQLDTVADSNEAESAGLW